MSKESTNTRSFYWLSWISFVVASGGTLAGLFLLDGSWALKGFLSMGYLFSISSCFTLAKAIRDKHEDQKLTKQVERARTEKLINEYTKDEL